MDSTESVCEVWQSVKPNKYCSCGYKCDCLQLIVKNKISTKRLFLRLEKENESDINLALSLNEFGLDEILNQFNHFKYCKAYHSIFHENKLNRIKRKPFAFQCAHHIEDLIEKPHIIHQLINRVDEESSIDIINENKSDKFADDHRSKINPNQIKNSPRINCQNHISSKNIYHSKEIGLNEIVYHEKESLIFTHEFTNFKNHSDSNEFNEIKCAKNSLDVKLRNPNNLIDEFAEQPKFEINKIKSDIKKIDKSSKPSSSKADNHKSITKLCCNKFALLRRYLNPFLCLLNILLIVIDFSSDILIARYHFVNESYVATTITFCFIYWAAYMHFLFDNNFSRKLDIFRRRFKFINLNNISTDLIIGVVHLFLPVKIFIESIYLVFNMYKWELRLINCRNEEKHQDFEVALRVCLRRAHKSNLIMALFKAFPQFLYQYYLYIIYLSDKETEINWLFFVTILSSLVTYIKNSYCGDLYYIEDNLNKNFEELRFLNIIKFNYLPFKFNIVLFFYNLTEFLLNFPFFLIFYHLKSQTVSLAIFKEYDFYLFILYIILFFKSYVTFFKNYLTSMKLEKDEDANWKKDVLFIRKRSTNAHVNYLFILRLIVSCVFLISLSNTFNAKNYYLILFVYFMLLAITAIGYILKITIVADQLINLRNFYTWKAIFSHLENLNGFSIYNEKLFNQWIEKIIFENYYFQWKVLLYNAYHVVFK